MVRSLLVVVAIWQLALLFGFPPTGQAQDFVELVNRVKPSVAFVLSFGPDGKPQGSGTGFLIGRGVLLTALHVVEQANQVSAEFPGQPSAKADVVAIDTVHDLALLHVPGAPQPGPIPLALGNSKSLQLGETVAVVGYPLPPSPENHPLTVTQGIVSALRTDMGFLQIDAPINPGNSGGPVMMADGRVVGVVDASLRDAQNFNLAVPIDEAKDLIARAGEMAPLPLPLTSATQLFLEQSGGKLDAGAHDEKEGAACVDPPPHAAKLMEVAVAMNVQKPLHMLAWLSLDRGAAFDSQDAFIFAQINDSVIPQLAPPMTHLDMRPSTVCLNYIAWNPTSGSTRATFNVKYTLGYRVFNSP